MRLNLNKTVKFKLTERGKELYREYFSPLPDCFEKPEPRIDEDGFTEMQLWMFMEIFGEHMSMWKPNVIEPLEIVFDTEDSESVKEQKIKLESDLISRQAAIEYIDNYAHMLTTGNYFEGMMNAVDLLKRLNLFPPVEPKPVCDDCISRADLPKKLNGVVLDNCDKIVEEFLEEHECDELWNVVRALRDFYEWTIDAPSVVPTERTGEWIVYPLKDEGRVELECSECGYTIDEDCISKHDLWRIIEDNAYWVTYNETSKEKGMTLTGINQALNECPPVEPKPVITEEVREAIMLLTTCAREECSICKYENDCGYDKQVEMATENMNTILNVFLERPKGEWKTDMVYAGIEFYRCDQCEYRQSEKTRYCPNCGADMRGDK